MLTRRTNQQQFLLRPDDELNALFLYILADAVVRYGIRLLGECVESDHHHCVFQDPRGQAVEFYEHLHKMMAKAGNALRGRRDHFWSADAPNLVELVEPEDVLDKLVYCLTNPVKDFLVARVRDWPGVNTMTALLEGSPIVCPRPRTFFRAGGGMPAKCVLELVIPSELGDSAEFLRQLRERVAAVEEQVAAACRAGRRVLGRERVLAQDWRDRATSTEPPGELRPVIAAKNQPVRVAALQRLRDFIGSYRRAREQWVSGKAAIFPLGTYWLRRFGGVAVEPCPAC